MDKSIIRSLVVISLCIVLILLQIFFPYFYYSSSSRNPNSAFEVGVHYVYEQDNVKQIYNKVSHIHVLGFKIIRANLVCDLADLSDYLNNRTDEFFAATQHFNMSVVLAIQNHDSNDKIQYYLSRWGKYLSYIQVLNEPELSSSWDVGTLFTDDEIVTKFQEVHSIVEPY